MKEIKDKRPKVKPRVALFLKNIANGMMQAEGYLAAGFQAKSMEVANAAASRLLRHVNENMSDKDLIDVMVPTSTLAGTVSEILQSSPIDDTRLRAASLVGKWKGLETPEAGLNQGATIIIMQSERVIDPLNSAIDVTPRNDTATLPAKRKSISD